TCSPPSLTRTVSSYSAPGCASEDLSSSPTARQPMSRPSTARDWDIRHGASGSATFQARQQPRLGPRKTHGAKATSKLPLSSLCVTSKRAMTESSQHRQRPSGTTLPSNQMTPLSGVKFYGNYHSSHSALSSRTSIGTYRSGKRARATMA
ncbi:hypothetical protein CYLTODRAFT_461701, partial [Cylindrobasidium torrendii FP15055 ss-10]